MRGLWSFYTLAVLLLFSEPAVAHDKVVVIPLGGKTAAGQSCSAGGYVTGIDANGNIICQYSSKYVFITTMTFTGNLGGISGADAKCQAEADAAALPGSYKAWLSDDSSSPAALFQKSNHRYILPGGDVIADGWLNLIDGLLDNAIDQHADGSHSSHTMVWTGTSETGTGFPIYDCSQWFSGGTSGFTGVVAQVNWTEAGVWSCSNDFALYCFEQ